MWLIILKDGIKSCILLPKICNRYHLLLFFDPDSNFLSNDRSACAGLLSQVIPCNIMLTKVISAIIFY